MNRRRTAALKRDPKTGRILDWKGGAESNGQKQNFHGTKVHIGALFKKEHGRAAKLGEVFRRKTATGAYDSRAEWYVRTRYGWRASGLRTPRLSLLDHAVVMAKSRPSPKKKT